MSRDPFDDHPIALSNEERDAVQAWVDRAKPMLGLPHWSIKVTRHKSDKGALATSFVRDHADESFIALPDSLVDVDPSELRQTLTHELLHCHLQPLTRLVEDLIEHELGKRTEAVIETSISHVEERTIERMAAAIACFLPFVEVPNAAQEGAQPKDGEPEHQDAGARGQAAQAGSGDRVGHPASIEGNQALVGAPV